MTAFIDADALRSYPHASSRSAVVATEGVVATSQPLAAQAGLSVLADGGTAVDAAIATAAALTVVEPCSNGLGGDAFALVWNDGQLHGLNGSGRWPMANDAEELRTAGHTSMPERGWHPVTVPGAVDAWGALHERFGRLPFDRLMAPARRFAELGHGVAPMIAVQWERAAAFFAALDLPETKDWATVFAPDGAAPRAGERWRAPGHALTLRTIAERGARDFYEGEVASAIVDYAARTGGRLSARDLADHRAEWVDPIGVNYRGHDIWEIPPNGQGIAALLALGIVANTDVADHPQVDVASWHLQIEAMKLAFADSDAFVGDQEHVDVPVTGLLDPSYLAQRATLIGDRAGSPAMGEPQRGGTVYLCTADRDGQMVSFIQSNYMGFGSGVVVPSHGIALHNRGAGFTLESGHPNAPVPGKRPRHTIIPGFITRGDEPIGPFGVMGGEMQPQGHLQVVNAMIDHGLNPQSALDTPRWQVERSGKVLVEPQVPVEIVEGLRARGHEVEVQPNRMAFGRGQIIVRLDDDVLVAGSEPRADGAAVGL